MISLSFISSLFPEDQNSKVCSNLCGELVYRFTHKNDGACTECHSNGFVQNESNIM